VSFDSRLIPAAQNHSPKRWRALSQLKSDPLWVARRWFDERGLGFPVRLGSTRALMGIEPALWAELSEPTSAPSLKLGALGALGALSALTEAQRRELLSPAQLLQATQAMTRCAAVYAAEHLEGAGTSGPLSELWGELCLWATHVALLQIDLKRPSAVHLAHRRKLKAVGAVWSHFHPLTINTVPSARLSRATLSNLEHLPHLGTRGAALGAQVSLAAHLMSSVSALGQWFWVWIAQSPELLSAIQYELRAALNERPYSSSQWSSLPTLSSTVFELMRLYPPEWCLSLPLAGAPASSQLKERLCASSDVYAAALRDKRAPGRLLLMSYWHQRDEAVWERASHFEPRRHLPYVLRSECPPLLRPFGLRRVLMCARGELCFHALMALLTGLLRRGAYLADESSARALSQSPPALRGGVIAPAHKLIARFAPSDHLSYVKSSRV